MERNSECISVLKKVTWASHAENSLQADKKSVQDEKRLPLKSWGEKKKLRNKKRETFISKRDKDRKNITIKNNKETQASLYKSDTSPQMPFANLTKLSGNLRRSEHKQITTNYKEKLPG